MVFPKKVNQEQYETLVKKIDNVESSIRGVNRENKTIKWVVGVGIAASLTLSAISLNFYFPTNQRIDVIYQENQKIWEEIREMKALQMKGDYTLEDLKKYHKSEKK